MSLLERFIGSEIGGKVSLAGTGGGWMAWISAANDTFEAMAAIATAASACSATVYYTLKTWRERVRKVKDPTKEG